MTPEGIRKGAGKNAACIGCGSPGDHESSLAILHRIEAVEPRLDCLNRTPAQDRIRREVCCGRAIGEIAACIADQREIFDPVTVEGSLQRLYRDGAVLGLPIGR